VSVLRALARAAGGALGAVVLLLVRALAAMLSGLRLGRLLRAVSMPHFEQHRLRTALSVLGVALGVALLVAVITVNHSVLRGLVDTIEDISGKADLEVSAGSSGFSDALTSDVRAMSGVAKAAPVLQQVATLLHPRASGERLFVIGTDWLSEDDGYFRAYNSANLEQIKLDPLPFLNAPHNVLLARALATRLGLARDDKLAVATGTGVQELVVKGFLEGDGIGDAFGGAIAVMDYQAMQLFFSRGRNIDRLDVAIAEGASLSAVRTRLAQLLGGGFTVAPPAQKGERIARMLLGVRTALTMASVIALFVGAFLIYNTMTISVVQRKREIGTLRALGARRRDVQRLLTLEGALLGAVGALAGLGLGSAISRALLRATSSMLNETHLQVTSSEVHVDARILVSAALLGMVSATLAAALGARAAGALSPAETLRTAGMLSPNAARTKLGARDLGAVFALVVAWAVLKLPSFGALPLPAFAAIGILLGVGVLLLPRVIQLEHALVGRLSRFARLELRLANQNLTRDLGRTTTTSGALLVGVAMVTAFGTFITSFTAAIQHWVEQTIPGDLFITHGSSMPGASLRNVPLADTLRAELSSLPEVTDLRRVHVVEVPYRGLSLKLVAMDSDVFARHSTLACLEGNQEQAIAGLSAGGVVISENLMRRFGLHRGGTLALASGRGTRRFPIAAVVVDYTSDLGTLLFDRATFIAAYGDERVSTYELYLRDGADVEATRKTILRRYAQSHDLHVLTNRELRRDVQGRVDQVFSLLRALELVALLVAVLGIVNALLANLLDRVREIGVLRALGMSRRALSRMILLEALLIGAAGLIAGLLVGFAVGHVMLRHVNVVSTGWYFPFRVAPGSLFELSLLTLVAAAAAGYYPARSAARLGITDALGRE
jgi:putative ABC transport system permease protein